jgi:hypothetical protein
LGGSGFEFLLKCFVVISVPPGKYWDSILTGHDRFFPNSSFMPILVYERFISYTVGKTGVKVMNGYGELRISKKFNVHIL